MINDFIFMGLGLVLVVLVIDAIHGYVTTSGTVWTKLLAIGKTSATILVARLGAIGGLSLNAAVQLADILGSPAVSSALTTYVDAKAVGYTLAVAAVVVEFARRRNLRVVVPATPEVAPLGFMTSEVGASAMVLAKAPILGQTPKAV